MLKGLKDYIDEGYAVVVSSSSVAGIRRKYPKAVVFSNESDGIGGNKLLVDRWIYDSPAIRAALPKFNKEDVVIEKFSTDFVNKESAYPTVEYRLTDDGIPRVQIDGKVVPIVSASFQYVTNYNMPGSHVAVFTYLCEKTNSTKIVSIDSSIGKTFFQ